jgi:hypothetical protein
MSGTGRGIGIGSASLSLSIHWQVTRTTAEDEPRPSTSHSAIFTKSQQVVFLSTYPLDSLPKSESPTGTSLYSGNGV